MMYGKEEECLVRNCKPTTISALPMPGAFAIGLGFPNTLLYKCLGRRDSAFKIKFHYIFHHADRSEERDKVIK